MQHQDTITFKPEIHPVKLDTGKAFKYILHLPV